MIIKRIQNIKVNFFIKYNLLFFILIIISKYSFSQILPSYHAVHHKPGIIKSNLILHLDASNTNSFDSNDLTSWNDLSSSENDLSLVVGGVSYSSDNGGIINFNDDAFRKATFTNFTGNQFTLSMWVRTTQGNGRLFSVARASCCYGKQMIFWTNNSKIGVYGGGDGGSVIEPIWEVDLGELIRFEYTLENNGKQDENNVRGGLYISTNDWISKYDRLIGTNVWPLISAQGAAYTFQLEITIPNDLQRGRVYWVGYIIDDNNTVHEKTGKNNAAYVPVWIN